MFCSQGNFAMVYLVRINLDKNQKARVAVKVLKHKTLNLDKEVDVHRRLSHPNIIRFLDACSGECQKDNCRSHNRWDESFCFFFEERDLLITEYANSETLLRYVKNRKITEEGRQIFCREICEVSILWKLFLEVTCGIMSVLLMLVY